MKVILFGATGMVGSGVLIECLEDGTVDAVLAVGRTEARAKHPKLRQVVHADFFDYTAIAEQLVGHDACFFCLGVSSVRKSETEYHRLTYELTLAAAETLARLNPGSVFCYVSGERTDSSEEGGSMWARVKGKTENALLRLPLDAYMFRPGFIRPLKGVRPKTRIYQVVYDVSRPLWPFIRRVFPRHVTTTENVGRAMIRVAAHGYDKRILENPDINAVAHVVRSHDGRQG